MKGSALKISIYMAISLMLLFAPFLLEISQNGKTYAFSSRSHNNRSNVIGKKAAGDKDGTFGYKIGKEDPNETEPAPPAPVPEPATWLLFGAGAAGLAAFRKKFKKK